MSYEYDEPSEEIREPGGNKIGWAATAAAAGGVLALLFVLLSGGPGTQLTFMSSVVEPPLPNVEWWDKALAIDATPVPWWLTVGVADGEFITMTVVDALTATAAFTLTEVWDASLLTLTAWLTHGGGTVNDGTPGQLVWAAAPTTTTWLSLIKLWEMVTPITATTRITETLVGEGVTETTTAVIRLMPFETTPTPVVTPSPTPRYTPQPWPTVSYPTPTPCVGLGCDPVGDIDFTLWLPLVLQNAEQWTPYYLPPVMP